MSYHWENVIWQSKDGSWNRGYFHRVSRANASSAWSDEDYDSEWDDDFEYDSFDYLATRLPSVEAAWNFTPHGNPGSGVELAYAGNSKECKAYDQLAHWFQHPEEKLKFERKEHLRKCREHFKQLSSEWTPDAIQQALANRHTLKVELKGDDKVYEQWGLTSTVVGVPESAGAWLTVKGERVYNLKTKKFHKRVRGLARYGAPRGFSYGFGR